MDKKLLFRLPLFFTVLVIMISIVSALTASIGYSRIIIHSIPGEIIEKNLLVRNVNEVPVSVALNPEGDLAENIVLQQNSFILQPGEEREVHFTIFTNQEGTTESKIRVTFEAENEVSVGLSSTIRLISKQEPFVIISNPLLKYNLQAGKKADVKLTIINTNPDLTANQEFLVHLENFESWSDLVEINPSRFIIDDGSSRTITLTFEINPDAVGQKSFFLVVESEGKIQKKEVLLNIGEFSFCELGTVEDELKIKNVDINNEGEGKDDEWKLLDTIEVEVEVENDGDDDIDDVMVEIGLFDSNGDNVINDVYFDNSDEEEVDIGDLNDGDEETVRFKFRVPADMEDGNYKLAVKTYSDKLGEGVACDDGSSDLSDDLYERISIDREDDEGNFIAFEDVVLTSTQATCGDLISLGTDVYNIGDEDQDQVRINLRSLELGIDESYEITNDLDQGDKEEVRIDFQIPTNAQNKTYMLELSSQYDYRNGIYRESSDNSISLPILVVNCNSVMGEINLSTEKDDPIILNKEAYTSKNEKSFFTRAINYFKNLFN